MAAQQFSDDELRQLANIAIKCSTDICLIFSPEDARAYLDYLVSGVTSFREGFERDA